ETRLADAGRAEDREQLARPVALRLVEGVPQPPELRLPADERRVEPAREGLVAVNRDQAMGAQRLALALQLERRDRLGLRRVAREGESLVAAQGLAPRPGPL